MAQKKTVSQTQNVIAPTPSRTVAPTSTPSKGSYSASSGSAATNQIKDIASSNGGLANIISNPNLLNNFIAEAESINKTGSTSSSATGNGNISKPFESMKGPASGFGVVDPNAGKSDPYKDMYDQRPDMSDPKVINAVNKYGVPLDGNGNIDWSKANNTVRKEVGLQGIEIRDGVRGVFDFNGQWHPVDQAIGAAQGGTGNVSTNEFKDGAWGGNRGGFRTEQFDYGTLPEDSKAAGDKLGPATQDVNTPGGSVNSPAGSGFSEDGSRFDRENLIQGALDKLGIKADVKTAGQGKKNKYGYVDGLSRDQANALANQYNSSGSGISAKATVKQGKNGSFVVGFGYSPGATDITGPAGMEPGKAPGDELNKSGVESGINFNDFLNNGVFGPGGIMESIVKANSIKNGNYQNASDALRDVIADGLTESATAQGAEQSINDFETAAREELMTGLRDGMREVNEELLAMGMQSSSLMPQILSQGALRNYSKGLIEMRGKSSQMRDEFKNSRNTRLNNNIRSLAGFSGVSDVPQVQSPVFAPSGTFSEMPSGNAFLDLIKFFGGTVPLENKKINAGILDSGVNNSINTASVQGGFNLGGLLTGLGGLATGTGSIMSGIGAMK